MSARRPWAWPLVPFYRAGLMAKDGLRAARILKTRELGWPVISVGSLSAGGAGKTPVVMALAELLSARGWTVDVLSRGYRRGGSAVEQVRPDAEDAARRFGDEPVEIVRRTGVPVWVASERFKAGQAAEGRYDSSRDAKRVHLLDDGFQHRQLERKVDIVLITEADVEDSLLPAGNLREPLDALVRADVIVVREEERERIVTQLKKIAPASVTYWTIERRLAVPALSDSQFAFCAIARPEDFLGGLCDVKVAVADHMFFADHHHYTSEDIERLIAASDRCGAQGFITTEKDAVKLSPAMCEMLASRGPLTVARLETHFLDEDEVVRDLEARLK